MALSKLNPWNWFKKENEQDATLPVRHSGRETGMALSPLDQFHTEFDRMVQSMFSGMGVADPSSFFTAAETQLGDLALKPKVDISGTDTEYVIEADLPGVEETDVAIEQQDDTLVLTAEKHHEEKTEDKGYYRMERSSGSFRRVFDLPDDADREHIAAHMTKGVLRVTIPRTGSAPATTRKIEIKGPSID